MNASWRFGFTEIVEVGIQWLEQPHLCDPSIHIRPSGISTLGCQQVTGSSLHSQSPSRNSSSSCVRVGEELYLELIRGISREVFSGFSEVKDVGRSTVTSVLPTQWKLA